MRPRALVAGFLLFALAVSLFRSVETPRAGSALDPRVTTQSTAPRGARALYLWLRALGYPTRSWRKPLTALGPGQDVLFVLEPTQDVTDAQADALVDWVRAGGVLFVAPGTDEALDDRIGAWVDLAVDDTDPSAVRGDRVVPDHGEHWRYRVAHPAERGQFAYPVEEVAVRGDARVLDPTGQHSILFARDGLGLAAEVYVGEGMVVVLPEADLLTNRGLGKARNAELVASLVEDWIESGTEVWFDEYDHGHRVAASLITYLGRRRPGLFALVLAAAAVLAVARWGRALTVRPEIAARRRRRPTEFVAALGGLYARSGAVAPAWAALAAAGGRVLRGDPAGVRVAPPGAPGRARRLAELEAALAPGDAARGERDLVRLAGALARAVAPRREAG